MFTLALYEPEHFHAALTLRRPNSRVAPDVYLYATPGPERDAFVGLIRSFNERSDDPTHWRLHVMPPAGDLLGQLISDGKAELVVLAGRNRNKLATMARLHQARVPVLADKPWATSRDALPALAQVTAGAPLAMDIMTERFDVVAALRHRLVATPAVFGEFDRHSAAPTIELALVHHLYKVVNGKPVKRPGWYYDVREQGDGLVDVQSHMVDQAQWLVGAGDYDFERDVTGLTAKRWSTIVSPELFALSTGLSSFPDALTPWVDNDSLSLACNGEIEFTLKGVRVRTRSQWFAQEPEGGGDLHNGTVRGTRAHIKTTQGASTGYQPELSVIAQSVNSPDEASIESSLAKAIADWQEAFPGIAMEPSDNGFRIHIPAALRTGHESHFAMVLEQYLDYLEHDNAPATLASTMATRYRLLAEAQAAAVDRSLV